MCRCHALRRSHKSRYWLKAHGYAADEGLYAHVFEAAKTCDHTFTNDEVHELCRAYTSLGD